MLGGLVDIFEIMRMCHIDKVKRNRSCHFDGLALGLLQLEGKRIAECTLFFHSFSA